MTTSDDHEPRPQAPAPAPSRPGHDVFVSYSTGDKHVADAIVARLEQAGIRCWVAPRDVMPGTIWGEAIVRAIETSRLMVLVLSDAANQSRQVIREVERAVAHDVVVVPFRIEAIQPTGAMAYYLASEHWLDALTPPLETHIAQLVGVSQAILGIAPATTAEQPATPGLPVDLSPASGAATLPVPAAPQPAAPAVLEASRPPQGPRSGSGRTRPVLAIVAVVAVLLLGLLGGWVAAIGPLASGGDSRPTVAPSDSPVASRTADPTPRPTSVAATMVPRFATIPDDRALKAAIPLEVSDSCETIELQGSQTAAVRCEPYGTLGVYYWQYGTVADLVEDWSLLPSEEGVSVDSGGCSDGTEGEGPWTLAGGDASEAGRVACFQTDGPVPVLTWTDPALRIRGWAFGTVGMGLDFLHQRWSDGAFGLDHALGALVLGVDGQAPIVPAGVRERCEPIDTRRREAAAVRCWSADLADVTYALYGSREALDADWGTLSATHALVADSGERCGDGVAGEAGWSFPGDPDDLDRGRILCANTGRGQAVLAWSDHATLTLVTVEGGSMAELHARWSGGTLDPVAPGD